MYVCCVGEWSEPWLYSWHGDKDVGLHDVPEYWYSESVAVSRSACTHHCLASRPLCRVPSHVLRVPLLRW